jgi:antitoxin FitA
MGAIQVKNVPERVHEAIRKRAAAEGVTVGEYVLRAVKRDLALPTQKEWLARVSRRPSVKGVDVVATLDAVRSEREKELDSARRP